MHGLLCSYSCTKLNLHTYWWAVTEQQSELELLINFCMLPHTRNSIASYILYTQMISLLSPSSHNLKIWTLPWQYPIKPALHYSIVPLQNIPCRYCIIKPKMPSVQHNPKCFSLELQTTSMIFTIRYSDIASAWLLHATLVTIYNIATCSMDLQYIWIFSFYFNFIIVWNCSVFRQRNYSITPIFYS